MPRLVIDLVLKHFPGTEDPLRTRYEQYVLLELVSTASGESDLAAKLESILEKAFEDGLVLDAAISQSEAQAREFWKLRRSEEHTSELQSLMRISYAVFCLKKKNTKTSLTIRNIDSTQIS